MNNLIIFAFLSLLLLFSCNQKEQPKPFAKGEFKTWAQTPPMGWKSRDCHGPTVEAPFHVEINLSEIGISGTCAVTDLWRGENLGGFSEIISRDLNSHACGLFSIKIN